MGIDGVKDSVVEESDHDAASIPQLLACKGDPTPAIA